MQHDPGRRRRFRRGGEQCCEVEIEDAVAIAEQDAFVQQAGGGMQGATGAGASRCRAGGDADRAGQAGRDLGDDGFQLAREMLGEQQEFVHAEADQLGHEPGQERPAAIGQGRRGRRMPRPVQKDDGLADGDRAGQVGQRSGVDIRAQIVAPSGNISRSTRPQRRCAAVMCTCWMMAVR